MAGNIAASQSLAVYGLQRAALERGNSELACWVCKLFSLENIGYTRMKGVGVWRCMVHVTLNRNVQIMPDAKWLKLLVQNILDMGAKLVRYDDWYNNTLQR